VKGVVCLSDEDCDEGYECSILGNPELREETSVGGLLREDKWFKRCQHPAEYQIDGFYEV